MSLLHLFPMYVANVSNGKPAIHTEDITATTDIRRVKVTLGKNKLQSIAEDNDYELHVFMLFIPCTVPIEQTEVKGVECYTIPNVNQVKYMYMGRHRYQKQSDGSFLVTQLSGDTHEETVG